MDKIIVYVDDAAYARQQLTPMLGTGQHTRWELVACPAHLTRHARRWISHSALEKWRNEWSQRLLADITPLLRNAGHTVTLHVAHGTLVDMTRRAPNPPGIFVLDDGMGLVAKRLEHIPNSDPPAVRVISDNKHYPEYERTADEIHIVGRIRWFAREI